MDSVQEATKLFLESPPYKEGDPTIFLTLTQKEATFLHMASALAVDAMKTSFHAGGFKSEEARVIAARLLLDSMVTDRGLWEKIMGAVKVQVMGLDPDADVL